MRVRVTVAFSVMLAVAAGGVEQKQHTGAEPLAGEQRKRLCLFRCWGLAVIRCIPPWGIHPSLGEYWLLSSEGVCPFL